MIVGRRRVLSFEHDEETEQEGKRVHCGEKLFPMIVDVSGREAVGFQKHCHAGEYQQRYEIIDETVIAIDRDVACVRDGSTVFFAGQQDSHRDGVNQESENDDC